MLLFLDESYEEIRGGKFNFAYAGFGIDEREYRGLVAAVYQAKQKLVGQITGLNEQQRIELGKAKLLQDEVPEYAEIKANKMMGTRQIKRLTDYGFSPGLTLAEEILRALQAANGTIFGVVSTPDAIRNVLNPSGYLPVEHTRLLERVELWMQEQHRYEMVSIVPDTIDSYKHNLSRCLADFLYRSNQGKQMRHIVVTPFWVDSSVTVGAQVADVVAYLLMDSQRSVTSSLTHLQAYVNTMEFRSRDGRTRGIRKIRNSAKSSQQAGV